MSTSTAADTKKATEKKKATKAAFGHRKSAQSGLISDLVAEQKGKFKPAALADKLKVDVSRVNDHLQHLQSRGIVEVNNASGEYTLAKMTADQRKVVDASASNNVPSEKKS